MYHNDKSLNMPRDIRGQDKHYRLLNDIIFYSNSHLVFLLCTDLGHNNIWELGRIPTLHNDVVSNNRLYFESVKRNIRRTGENLERKPENHIFHLGKFAIKFLISSSAARSKAVLPSTSVTV